MNVLILKITGAVSIHDDKRRNDRRDYGCHFPAGYPIRLGRKVYCHCVRARLYSLVPSRRGEAQIRTFRILEVSNRLDSANCFLCLHLPYISLERSSLTNSTSLNDRTPHIQDEDRSPTPCLTLHRFLSKHAMTLIFGGGEMKDATKQSASRAAAKRKVPSVSIYVLSNSRDHERDLVQLFRDVPSRLIRLRPSNFFTSKQLGGLSESMLSVGQYAAMYAAKKDHGSPILLLTGGNAITYVGIDKDSKFLGGGACPGMSIRCRSLFDFCTKDFPSVDFHEYKKITDKARLDKKPISLFATNMQVGIAANATAELAGHLRNIIKQFLKLVGPADTPATVVVTGEDLEILGQLLKEDCSGLIETEPDVAYPSSDKIAFTLRKNLTHYGVEHLLLANQKKRPIPNPDEETRDRFIGLRVATFKKPSKTTFRGSISRIVPGKKLEEDTFVVLLDDGETVYLDFLQIYGTLQRLYILFPVIIL